MELGVKLITGHINRILDRCTAEIVFTLKEVKHTATVDFKSYLYNAKPVISEISSFEAFAYVRMEVDFIAECLTQPNEKPARWNIILCWPKHHTLGNKVEMRQGVVSVVGYLTRKEKDEGVLAVDSSIDRVMIAYFTKSKLTFYSEELASSENWMSHLREMNKVRFDAIPCIPEDSADRYHWQATYLYIEPKSTISSVAPKSNSHVYRKVLQHIDDCWKNPQTLFVVGKGKFFLAIDDDFGLILAKFHDNIFRQVLFHKKNARVFNMCLENQKLSEILKKGDEMNFVAAGNLPNYADWIAVSVSIHDCRKPKRWS
ncbi:hypothetical protein M0802_010011 [Mischocyttarus mexicanus]|nr:hypothetical protein M0802_010011 [Mischocyttarus mexicanus]